MPRLLSVFLSLLLGLPVVHAFAQAPKPALPTSSKARNNNFFMAWPEVERMEFPDTAIWHVREYPHGSDLYELLHYFPAPVKEGKWIVRYPSGRVYSRGRYKHGAKQGRFVYRYPSGRKKSVQRYERGMPDGKWKFWDSLGHQVYEYAYRPFPDRFLSLLRFVSLSEEGTNLYENPAEDQLKNELSLREDLTTTRQWYWQAHRNRIRIFEEYIKNHLSERSVWDGDFRVWKMGKNFLSFSYKNNVPSGTWKLWQGDTLAFQMRFENGLIVAIHDFLLPEHNRQQEQQLADYHRNLKRSAQQQKERQKRDSSETALQKVQGFPSIFQQTQTKRDSARAASLRAIRTADSLHYHRNLSFHRRQWQQGVWTWNRFEYRDWRLNGGPPFGAHSRNALWLNSLLPAVFYDGPQTFYYPNGQRYGTGNYKMGVKNGRFDYWYPSGQKKSLRYYTNGMANGLWKTWDAQGRLATAYSYSAYTEEQLRSIYLSLVLGSTNWQSDEIQTAVAFFDTLEQRTKLLSEVPGLLNAHEARIDVFTNFVETNLQKHCIWNGAFKVWKEGRPYLAFQYEHNRPVGTWRMWKDGLPVFEMDFKGGKIIHAQEWIHTEHNEQQLAIKEQWKADSIRWSLQYDEGVRYVTPDAVNPSTASSSVDRRPEFPGGRTALQAYLKNHLQYSRVARAANIQGEVTVQFRVKASGDIDTASIIVQNGLGYGLDKETVRLIQEMPRWHPAERKGEPVDSRAFVTVTYQLPEKE